MLDDAEQSFRQADTLAEMAQALFWRSRICIGLARIAWVRGEVEDALDEIERGVVSASQLGTRQMVRDVRAWQARFWLRSHQLTLARRWADSSELDPYLPPEYERQIEHLTYVRLLIGEGRSDLALRVLRPIHEQAETAGRHGDLVELHLLAALAQRADGNFADALQSLHLALELGGPTAYSRVFVDEGGELAPLLRNLSRGSHRDYAQRLLVGLDGTTLVEVHRQRGQSEELSEREIEVLRLVATGLPNREISQRLFISEKTAKKHLSNILGKLQASNRTQAVDAARNLGLI
jgi:LuxR family maltose regulon positive regulatory protein